MTSSALARVIEVGQGAVGEGCVGQARPPARRLVLAERAPAWNGRVVQRPGEGPLYDDLARRRRRAQIAARHALGRDGW
jgi:hypothetical protein